MGVLRPARRRSRRIMLSGQAGFDENASADCATGATDAMVRARRADAPGTPRGGSFMATKRPAPRLDMPAPDALTPPQRALRDAIAGGPRGTFKFSGPFAIWLHAPELGQLAQALGAHVRYKTSLSPRLSEFAILTTARQWRAQYEWQAHAPIAEKAGVKPKTIADLKGGRRPKGAPADERVIYDFVTELY